jgi:REP element-mobilizing transposase RayT
MMARPLRLEFPGALYHVTARGNRRESIYQDDDDRCEFLVLVGDVCKRNNWCVHAYCLMSNHYHLVIETPEANLSKGMRQLNGRYAQRYNRRHNRVGHVFQGRYTAILVQKQTYLLELARYVVLNPVRANLSIHAGQCAWSSYRPTAGKESAPDWLKTDWLLSQFNSNRSKAQKQYIQFVMAGQDKSNLWRELRQQIYLGDDQFAAAMQEHLGTDEDLSEVPRPQHRPAALPIADYASRAKSRQEAMAQAYDTGQYTLRQIADYFGVHYSTVSRVLGRRKKT